MISAEAVQKYLAEGFAWPCSMCIHFHTARDRGEFYCGKETCGGPISGLGFPDYVGDLTRETIAKTCFRCGKDASKIVEGNKGPGLVGVCKRHLPMLSRVMETGDDPWKDKADHKMVDR